MEWCLGKTCLGGIFITNDENIVKWRSCEDANIGGEDNCNTPVGDEEDEESHEWSLGELLAEVTIQEVSLAVPQKEKLCRLDLTVMTLIFWSSLLGEIESDARLWTWNITPPELRDEQKTAYFFVFESRDNF